MLKCWMTDLLKITLVFAFILLLLRKKINIGFVMLIAAALLDHPLSNVIVFSNLNREERYCQ